MSPDGQANALERAVSLPTGSVTLLFTDIEGSTQRWERYGDAMRLAVERHDEIVRRDIEAHRGYVFKTVGDAFCAVFENADDAIAAAVAAQRALAREDFDSVGERWGYERLMEALSKELSGAAIETHAAEGATWIEDRAVDEVMRI